MTRRNAPRPAPREEAVPQSALDALWVWVERHPPALALLREALDPELTLKLARRFKTDVSIDLRSLEDIRWSVNDHEETLAFRQRVVPLLIRLGTPSSTLASFFGIGEMGRFSTSVSFKWEAGHTRGPRPDRVSLYYDGLPGLRGAERLRQLLAKMQAPDLPPPDPLPGPILAASIDLDRDRVTAFKDYYVLDDTPPPQMAPSLHEAFHRIPAHPKTGRRVRAFVRRFDRETVTGQRLGWVPEVLRPEERGPLLDVIDTVLAPWGDAARGWPEVRAWLEAWDTVEHRCIAMPDIVAFNVDAQGEPRSVQLYVTVR